MILNKFKAMLFGKKKSTVEDIQHIMNRPLSTQGFHPDNFEIKHPDKNVINYQSITADLIIELLDQSKECLETDSISAKTALKALRDLLVEYNEVIQKHVTYYNNQQLTEPNKIHIAKIPYLDYLAFCEKRNELIGKIIDGIEFITKEPLTKKIHKKKVKLFYSKIYFDVKSVLLEDTYFHILHYQIKS